MMLWTIETEQRRLHREAPHAQEEAPGNAATSTRPALWLNERNLSPGNPDLVEALKTAGSGDGLQVWSYKEAFREFFCRV